VVCALGRRQFGGFAWGFGAGVATNVASELAGVPIDV